MIGLGLLGLPIAPAQDRERPSRPARPSQNDEAPASTPRGFADPLAYANPFRPIPSDLGPLTPGESEELLRFARRRMSGVFRPLEELRRRDPAAFRRRLDDFAPKLRMMRRLFDEDPQVAEKVIQHVENMEQLRRVRRLWSAAKTREGRERARAQARELLEENQRIEAEVLEARAASLEAERERLVEREFRRATDADTDVEDFPPPLRRAIREWTAATTDERRARLEQEIRRRGGERVDMLVARLRSRAEEMRTSDPERLESRLDELLSDGPGPGDFAAPKRSPLDPP